MLSEGKSVAAAQRLVERAVAAGADAADALYSGGRSTGVQVRLGKLDHVSRSESEEIGLRVFLGARSASVASSDMSNAALGELVGRALAMATEAPKIRLQAWRRASCLPRRRCRNSTSSMPPSPILKPSANWRSRRREQRWRSRG